jgi:membrane associated rhomboid family serine protease
MGIYDRDYYRDAPPRGGFGVFSMASVTTWLIVLNVACFFLDQMSRSVLLDDYGRPLALRAPVFEWGAFSKVTAVEHFQVWRFVSFQFLHANLGHLFSNMLSLYLFGPIVESYFGRRRFTAFYLLCGCSGAVGYMLLLLAGVLHGDDVPLVGASAGIFGVLVAGAMLAPNVTIMLLFPPIPMQLKYLAMMLVAWAAYTAFTNGQNAGGQAAHLGGAVVGYALLRHPQVLAVFEKIGGPPRVRRPAHGRATTDWSKNFDR